MSATFEASWPIHEDGLDMTQRELVAIAAPDLPELLWEAKAEQAGPVTWSVEGAFLVARCDAEPWTDPAAVTADHRAYWPSTHIRSAA